MDDQAFSYQQAPYQIPAAKSEAYCEAWRYIAGPGSWWTGAERLAIARAAREAANCPLCLERAAALSPFAITGEHATADEQVLISAEVLDAVHRICTDSARLTSRWVNDLISDTFSYGHYVEMLSVIVTVVSIDSFHQVAYGMKFIKY